MTRKERLNNPFNKHKSEAEHIAHTIQRMFERYGLEINLHQYYDLLRLAQKDSYTLYSLNNSNSIKIVDFLGKEIWLIYGTSSLYKEIRIPGRIKTVLIPNGNEFPVPDRFDVESSVFASDVREVLNTAENFASRTIPHITAKELFTESEFDNLSKTFKTLTLKWTKLSKYTKLSMGFREVLNNYETRYRNENRNIHLKSLASKDF